MQGAYDARIEGRQILTPAPPAVPRITGPSLFGVRDLWRQKETGPFGDRFSAVVSPHGAAFVKVKP